MLAYYARLAARSLRRTPVMSALMIAAIAVGVAVTMTTLTLQHVMARNPLAERNDQLFAVQLDSWGDKEHFEGRVNNAIPDLLTWRDGQMLLRAPHARHKVVMHQWGAALTPEDPALAPMQVDIRVTSRDFFPLFGLTFNHGQRWGESADQQAEFVAVVTRSLSEQLFGSANPVGRTITLNGRPYTISGVVDDWLPAPSVHDLSTGSFNDAAQIYLPFGLHEALEMSPWGNINCWEQGKEISSYRDFLNSECIWLVGWVGLDDAASQQAFRQYLQGYIASERQQGRFPRTTNFALSTPSQWLTINNVVGNDNKLLTWLAFAFLLVCVANTVALLLAKFLRQAPEAGVRRALGASQGAIIIQYLVESAVIGAAGGLGGLLLAQLGLWAVRAQAGPNLARIVQMDGLMVITALLLALAASLLAGLYPAWRVSHTNPARYLKTQ